MNAVMFVSATGGEVQLKLIVLLASANELLLALSKHSTFHRKLVFVMPNISKNEVLVLPVMVVFDRFISQVPVEFVHRLQLRM